MRAADKEATDPICSSELYDERIAYVAPFRF